MTRRTPPPPAPPPPPSAPAPAPTMQFVDAAPILAAVERLAAAVDRLQHDVDAMPNAIAAALLLEMRRARAGIPPAPVEREFLTDAEAATIAAVNPRALRRMVDELAFPRPVRVGGNPTRDRRFVRAEVYEWVEARKAER